MQRVLGAQRGEEDALCVGGVQLHSWVAFMLLCNSLCKQN